MPAHLVPQSPIHTVGHVVLPGCSVLAASAGYGPATDPGVGSDLTDSVTYPFMNKNS